MKVNLKMKVNLIGMILNNGGWRLFDGLVVGGDGKPLSAADSIHMLMIEYAKVVGGGTSDLVASSREVRQPTTNVTDEMVTRFLGWILPKDFNPDNGISFDRKVLTADGERDRADMGDHWWPVGTNLLTADQARAMLEHVLSEPDENA